MKKLLTFVAVMVMTQMAMAIPAKRIVQTVRQPNGTELQVILRGDETFHFYTTIDGTPVRCNAQGYWETDTRDINALWRERASLRAEQRRPAAERIRRQLREEAQRRAAARKKVATRADGDGSNTETEVQKKKGLLVLVNFKDKTLSTPTARIKTVYDQILNSVNNPYGDNYGSVHEYFLAQSYGELDVEFDVAGPVTLKNNMSYYGKDDGGEGNDAHPEEMVVEALKGVNRRRRRGRERLCHLCRLWPGFWSTVKYHLAPPVGALCNEQCADPRRRALRHIRLWFGALWHQWNRARWHRHYVSRVQPLPWFA